jgi:ssDNA-binding Zn-finger/Zn-ribbon topoisomerase 1
MKTIKGKTFISKRIDLDGLSFKDCKCSGCMLIWAGEPMEMDGCSLYDDCQFQIQLKGRLRDMAQVYGAERVKEAVARIIESGRAPILQ